MHGVIYKITCLINRKIYVGQTINFKRRINQHKRDSSKFRNGIDAAIAKYGWENFSVEVIEKCPVEQLNEREIFWIAELNSKVPNGYNLTDGGDGIVGCSEETRAKLALASKGRKFSEETRAKIGLASKNRRPNEETRAKMSVAHKHRRPPDEKTRAKMSAAQKGHKLLAKSCAKISAAKRKGNIFKNLLTAMDERQLTYTSLAKLLNMSSSAVSAKMRGMRNFTEKDAIKLGEIFGLPVEYLMSK
ncbi:MAG: GIY-YIG nuclease family protein [Selenomonadaceae bacterium]|nr:GIY-YIG nuclease family protein [Selenomonadaceae bacterium]